MTLQLCRSNEQKWAAPPHHTSRHTTPRQPVTATGTLLIPRPPIALAKHHPRPPHATPCSVPGARAKPYLRPGSSTPFAGHTSREFFRHEPAQFPAGGYEQIDWSAGGGAVSLQKSAGAYGGGTVYGSAYGGSATLDCQPLVYPPSHSSFNPYHSFASLVEPTPAYPLLAEQQPALGEFRSFSMPPTEQQAYQHATNGRQRGGQQPEAASSCE
ncbi:hypothetical protein PTTG_28128 [Puccinia triticina 1-1 BBBD Race 1]|uniref:Uncharacterized protein n=1 Tax=Puccinia triticina (isolate 1-1 / race 1 (BBBD)) TaxID=630390 RepID=A0A180GEM4_PUCT1|nr:hypothetical protein PTTG_28128 [Puccinia triticina 1-1 BBBD Race 1]